MDNFLSKFQRKEEFAEIIILSPHACRSTLSFFPDVIIFAQSHDRCGKVLSI